MEKHPIKRIYLLFCGLVVALFAYFKTVYIITTPLWLDEGFTYFYVQANSFAELIYRISLYEQNPIFFYFLTWITTSFFNSFHVLVLRLIPFVCSIASPVALYYLYKEIFKDSKGALTASVFLFISNFYTIMTCDARGYSLAIFLSIMGIFYYFRLLNNQKSSFIPFCIFWILALKTHFLALIMVSALLAHYLFFYKNTNNRDILIGILLIFLSFIPDILQIKMSMTDRPFWPGGATLMHIPELFYVSLIGYTFEFPHIAIWYALAVSSMILFFSVIFIKNKHKTSIWLFIILFLTVFLSTFLSSTFMSMRIFSIRHMILILPFYFIIIAYTINHIKFHWVKILIVLSFILLNLSSTISLVSKTDFEAVGELKKVEIIV
jgi:hypothetical protein